MHFAFDLKDLLQGFNVEMNQLSWQIIIVGIISSIVGIMAYVLLAAILGSLTSRIEDLKSIFDATDITWYDCILYRYIHDK